MNWRTLATGLALAVGTPALTYLAGVDWSKLVSSQTAFVISGLLMIALRAITTGPVFPPKE